METWQYERVCVIVPMAIQRKPAAFIGGNAIGKKQKQQVDNDATVACEHPLLFYYSQGSTEYPLWVDEYTIETITVYKGVPDDAVYGEGMSFVFSTLNDSGACGIFPEVGEEYLLDFSSENGMIWTMGSCGLTRPRSSITDEDMAILEDPAICDIDPCAEEPCGKFQVCTNHRRVTRIDDTTMATQSHSRFCW